MSTIDDEVHKHYRLYIDDDWHCIAMANVREFHETEHEALSAARAHRAAVIESSPEVAALRARVAEQKMKIASLRAALSTLVDAVYRVCDWSEGSRVGDALAEAEALLAPPTSTTANGEHDHG